MATLGCHIAQWWLRYADVTDLPYRPPEHKDVILHQNEYRLNNVPAATKD